MQKMMLQPPAAPQAFDPTDGATLLRDTHDAQGAFLLRITPFLKDNCTIVSDRR